MNSRTTSHPSSSSDLQRALDALKDLAETIPLRPDPLLLSAWHQAKLVLRRHGIAVDRAPGAGEVPAQLD